MSAWPFPAITPSVLPQVVASQTSFDAWATLEGIFNIKSKTRVIQLQNQLQTLRKKYVTVNEYFSKLIEDSKELLQVGVAIENGELSLITPNSLDESYESKSINKMFFPLHYFSTR